MSINFGKINILVSCQDLVTLLSIKLFLYIIKTRNGRLLVCIGFSVNFSRNYFMFNRFAFYRYTFKLSVYIDANIMPLTILKTIFDVHRYTTTIRICHISINKHVARDTVHVCILSVNNVLQRTIISNIFPHVSILWRIIFKLSNLLGIPQMFKCTTLYSCLPCSRSSIS